MSTLILSLEFNQLHCHLQLTLCHARNKNIVPPALFLCSSKTINQNQKIFTYLENSIDFESTCSKNFFLSKENSGKKSKSKSLISSKIENFIEVKYFSEQKSVFAISIIIFIIFILKK